MRPQVKHGQLENGMRYYATFDSSSWLSGIGVKCGAFHDPPGKSGMAHFVEHLVSRESKKYPIGAANRLYRKFLSGGNIKVETDFTNTFYGHQGLAMRWHMLRCFDMFASMILDPAIMSEGFDSEKAAVNQEYCQEGEDNIAETLDRLMRSTMYKTNPARKRIDCEKEELRTFAVADARRFIRNYYVPNNMFVVMLGPSFREVRETANRYFSDLKARPVPQLVYDHSDDFPKLGEVVTVEKYRATEQFYLMVAYPTETYLSPDAEALDVLAKIWSARLEEKLREENRVFDEGIYHVYEETKRTFTHGTISVRFSSSSRDFIRRAGDIAIEETKKLKKDLVSFDERDDIVKNLELERRSALRSNPNALADMIIDAVSNGDEELEHMHSYLRNLNRVSSRKLAEVANKYFTDGHIRVVIGPK